MGFTGTVIDKRKDQSADSRPHITHVLTVEFVDPRTGNTERKEVHCTNSSDPGFGMGREAEKLSRERYERYLVGDRVGVRLDTNALLIREWVLDI